MDREKAVESLVTMLTEKGFTPIVRRAPHCTGVHINHATVKGQGIFYRVTICNNDPPTAHVDVSTNTERVIAVEATSKALDIVHILQAWAKTLKPLVVTADFFGAGKKPLLRKYQTKSVAKFFVNPP